MNPLSALVGGVSSLIGGFMNTSSAQAINSQNLQYAQEAASGQFLPQYYQNLVKGANAAGINPLAALGVSSGGGGGGAIMAPPDVGSGVARAGEFLSQIKDPHTIAMEKGQERKLEAEIQLTNANSAETLGRARTNDIVRGQLAGGHLIAPGLTEYSRDAGSLFSIPGVNRIGESIASLAGNTWRGLNDAVDAYDRYVPHVKPWDLGR